MEEAIDIEASKKFFTQIIKEWAKVVYQYLPVLARKHDQLVTVGDYDELDTSAFEKELDYFASVKLLPIYIEAVEKKKDVDETFIEMSFKRACELFYEARGAKTSASIFHYADEIASAQEEYNSIVYNITYAMAWLLGVKKISLPNDIQTITSEKDLEKLKFDYHGICFTTIQESMQNCCYRLYLFMMKKGARADEIQASID